jgi:hypothetical protein
VRVITIALNVKASAGDSEADKSAMFIRGREQLSQNMQKNRRSMPGLVQKDLATHCAALDERSIQRLINIAEHEKFRSCVKRLIISLRGCSVAILLDTSAFEKCKENSFIQGSLWRSFLQPLTNSIIHFQILQLIQ